MITKDGKPMWFNVMPLQDGKPQWNVMALRGGKVVVEGRICMAPYPRCDTANDMPAEAQEELGR